MQHTVQVSDAVVSADAADTIVTYSLGSCIGVALYDPVAKVGGLLHYQLPSAAMDAARAAREPCMFADSGLAHLTAAMERAGAAKARVKAKLAGGAAMIDDPAGFNIGKRNYAAIRKALFQHGLFVDGEDVGGAVPRTVYLRVADGALAVRAGGDTKYL
jgi:chemotaxis protein CheD